MTIICRRFDGGEVSESMPDDSIKIQLWALELGIHKGKHYSKQELPVCSSAAPCTNAAIKSF